MNVVNATTYANNGLVWKLESCRDHNGPTAAVKRRIRRQVRQHLAAELRSEVHQLHVDAATHAAELAVARRSIDRMVDMIVKDLDRPVKASKTVARFYEVATPKPERKVLVTRKLAGDPFKRKHVEVMTLTV